MPTAALRTYTIDQVKPVIHPELAVARPIKLAASQTVAKGDILGEVTGANEVQSITIDATGGTFTITYAGQTTSALSYKASAATVQAALEALSTISTGNISVTKILNRYTLTHSSGTDAGTFGLRLTVGGVSRTIEGIAWNETGANIDTLVEALDIIGTAGVAVTGSAGGPFVFTFALALGEVILEVISDDTNDGGVWEGGIGVALNPAGAYYLTFINDLGNTNVAAVTTGAGSLTGGAGTATVATVTAGSAGSPGYYKPRVSSATDGSQTGRCIAPCAMVSDSSNNITLGDTAGVSEHGETYKVVDAWFGGHFSCADVTGLTTTILSELGGKMVTGSIAGGGVFKF